ncbi:S41 family peptidase [Parasedimentitalea maritima]|uniref:S41 family peptidase n=1 Tax=Parasedimentitalea maritima TaxID=2578117 RepID=UPI0010FDA8E6|nr:S41 family peptidase [Zongyanglinia marina]
MRNFLRLFGSALALLCVGFGLSWLWVMPKGELKGVWQTDGYGLVIDVSSLWIDVYEQTKVSCLHQSRIPSHLSLVNWLEDVTFGIEEDRLRLDVSGVLNPIMADGIAVLPDICRTATPNAPGTAQENFDVAWQVMQEHYAFFDLHGVDWSEKRKTLRPAADAVLDDTALFALLSKLLTGLDDGHTYIQTPGDGFSPELTDPWHAERVAFSKVTAGAVRDGLTKVDGSQLSYGWLTPDIGFISFAGMSVASVAGHTDAAVATKALAVVAQELAAAKAIVLDIRFNPGGSDDVALAYASFFVDGGVPAFTKSTRSASGYTLPFTALIPDTPISFDQPSLLLTSNYSASAAEIFALAMQPLEHVQSMGTTTSGGLSDIMEVTLPNGWQLGFSHQRYLTLDGVLYEGIGVPAHWPRVMDVSGFRAGNDSLLEEAKQHLTAKISVVSD